MSKKSKKQESSFVEFRLADDLEGQLRGHFSICMDRDRRNRLMRFSLILSVLILAIILYLMDVDPRAVLQVFQTLLDAILSV
jgi:hypothetical protein